MYPGPDTPEFNKLRAEYEEWIKAEGESSSSFSYVDYLRMRVEGTDTEFSKKRGNAAALINWYENTGGAAIIQWGTKGDWTRCYQVASNYLDAEDAKGFCANRHKAATGFWPGEKKGQEEAGKYKKSMSPKNKYFSNYTDYLRLKAQEGFTICKTEDFSSRVCDLGTKSCVLDHLIKESDEHSES